MHSVEATEGNAELRLAEMPQEDVNQKIYISDLGEAACIRSRSLILNGIERKRQTWSIEMNDYSHYVRVTRPDREIDDGRSVPTIIHLPGLLEMIDGGTAYSLHNEVAENFPDHTIVSIATDGVSIHGEKLGLKEAFSKNFDQMAADRLALSRHFSGDEETNFVAISMGTHLVSKLLSQNLELPHDERLRVGKVVYVSSALVSSEKALKTMTIDFLPHMAINGIVNAAKHPKKAFKAGGMLGKLRRRHIFAIGGNILNLLQGIDPEDLAKVIQNYSTHVVGGVKCPLLQLEDLYKLQEEYPSNLDLTIIPGEGHSFTLDAHTAAQFITTAVNTNRVTHHDFPPKDSISSLPLAA